MTPSDDARKRGSTAGLHYGLLLLPFIWQVALAPWANGIAWHPAGLPFQMAWQMAGIVFSTIVIATVYRIDDMRSTNDTGDVL